MQTEVDKLLAADPRAAPSPARHPARCVHPVAGHHQPRQRPADAPPGPLGRPARRQPPPHPGDGGQAAAGQRHPRRADRGRGRAGKPAAAMARTGRAGCATKPRTSKTPTAWSAPPPTGSASGQQRILAAGRHPPGRGRNPGRQTRLPRPPRPHPRLPARLPAARRRPHRGRESNASKPNCKRPKQHAAALRKRSRILVAVLAVTAIIAVVAVILGRTGQPRAHKRSADSRVSARQPACGWSPRPSQCWPVPVRRRGARVPTAGCGAKTGANRRMTVHCSLCCPRWSTSSRSSETPDTV